VGTGDVALTNFGLLAGVGKLRDFTIAAYFSADIADWGSF
jgi:hypothetical protein